MMVGADVASIVLQQNLAALRDRGVRLTERWAEWRPAGAPLESTEREQDEARQAAARALGPASTAAEAPKPIVVEGFSTPWMLLEARRATPPTPDGYSPRLIVVEPESGAAIAGLSSIDLSEVVRDPRVEWFLGEGALERFDAWLRDPSRQATALPGQILRSSGGSELSVVEPVLRAAHEAQGRWHEALRAQTHALYAGRDRAFWASRFAGGAPLRVLLPISRYSTFVRRSAEDLAESLRALGHEALVLTEPDAHSKLTTPAYLSAFESLRPDLVVLINYTRRHMGQAVPPGVPFVCWVQDRMAHLFDPAAGAAQADRDFLVGHLHPDLFSHFGFPRCRRLFAFVPASTRRFHDGPVDPSLRRRFECEVAYVSHQSETPEAFHARIAPMFASNPSVRRALDPLRDAAVRWLDAADADPGASRPVRERMVTAALADAGLSAPDPRLVFTVFGNYLVPLMERMLRHRTLAWAATICERRGWRLRLYGRGWDRHATLGRWAMGESLEGGDELRAAYRSAAAHLHMSLNTNSHQRVYEGALSGGLVLRRGPSPDWELAKIGMMRLAAEQPPAAADPDGSTLHESRAEHGADPLQYFAMRAIPPVRDDAGRPVYRRTLSPSVRRELLDVWPHIPLDTLPDFAYPESRETLFITKVDLERLLTRAVDEPDWRGETIRAHRAATLRACTYDRLASAMLDLVRAGLSKEAHR